MNRSGYAAVGVTALVLFSVVLSGAVDVTPSTTVGDGSASVSVREPTETSLRLDPGRFGSRATYLRVPDAVVDVADRSGRPRLVYRLVVPELDISETTTRTVTRTGRFRLEMADHGLPPGTNGTYRGHVTVRVQSFTDDTTVLNRTVRVVPS
jgi:hypothetical protein